MRSRKQRVGLGLNPELGGIMRSRKQRARRSVVGVRYWPLSWSGSRSLSWSRYRSWSRAGFWSWSRAGEE